MAFSQPNHGELSHTVRHTLVRHGFPVLTDLNRGVHDHVRLVIRLASGLPSVLPLSLPTESIGFDQRSASPSRRVQLHKSDEHGKSGEDDGFARPDGRSPDTSLALARRRVEKTSDHVHYESDSLTLGSC